MIKLYLLNDYLIFGSNYVIDRYTITDLKRQVCSTVVITQDVHDSRVTLYQFLLTPTVLPSHRIVISYQTGEQRAEELVQPLRGFVARLVGVTQPLQCGYADGSVEGTRPERTPLSHVDHHQIPLDFSLHGDVWKRNRADELSSKLVSIPTHLQLADDRVGCASDEENLEHTIWKLKEEYELFVYGGIYTKHVTCRRRNNGEMQRYQSLE